MASRSISGISTPADAVSGLSSLSQGKGLQGSMGRRPISQKMLRLVAPMAVLIAFLAIATIYVAAPAVYAGLMRIWGIPVSDFPFLDLHAVISALECKRQGFDVMRSNPCDVLFLYSPLWLEASILPIDHRWLVPTGIALNLLFILTLFRLPTPATRGGIVVILAASFSPMIGYALERANVDVLLFVVIVMSTPPAAALWPRRLVSYGIILLAGLLKYYPLALLLLALRETLNRLLTVTAVVLLISVLFLFHYRFELAEEAALLHGYKMNYYTDTFGVTNLPYGLVALLPQIRALVEPLGLAPEDVGKALLAIFLFILMRRALPIARYHAAAFARLPHNEDILLTIGLILIVGCFFAGGNVLYRGIYLLLTLPGLLALASLEKDSTTFCSLRQTIGLILFLMWSEFFRHAIEAGVVFIPSERVANAVRALFWAIKELIWWRVIAVFCGLLLAFIADSTIGRSFGRYLRWFKVTTV
jgi:hypothetical protein